MFTQTFTPPSDFHPRLTTFPRIKSRPTWTSYPTSTLRTITPTIMVTPSYNMDNLVSILPNTENLEKVAEMIANAVSYPNLQQKENVQIDPSDLNKDIF